jgi:hypothetical protein
MAEVFNASITRDEKSARAVKPELGGQRLRLSSFLDSDAWGLVVDLSWRANSCD